MFLSVWQRRMGGGDGGEIDNIYHINIDVSVFVWCWVRVFDSISKNIQNLLLKISLSPSHYFFHLFVYNLYFWGFANDCFRWYKLLGYIVKNTKKEFVLIGQCFKGFVCLLLFCYLLLLLLFCSCVPDLKLSSYLQLAVMLGCTGLSSLSLHIEHTIYSMFMSSTSKVKRAFGGMIPGCPRAP